MGLPPERWQAGPPARRFDAERRGPRSAGPPPAGPARSMPGPRPGAGRSLGSDRPWDARPGRGHGAVPEGWVARPPRPPEAPPSEAVLADDEELIAGRHPVEEAFVAGRLVRRLLVTPGRRDALERLVLHATALRIPVIEIGGGSLTALCGFDGHQGIALVVEPRPAAGIADVLARAIERDEPALVLALDSLEDPQNVGTLLRSAEAAGVHGIVFPTRRQAPLSPAAIKASAGATEHLLLAPVDDLPGVLADLHVRGLRVVGTDAEAPLTYREADLRGPLVLVVGSEGHGLAPAIRRRCDLLVKIPMRGRIESLNAAVAGSVLVFEAAAQRGLPERTAGAPALGGAAAPAAAAAPEATAAPEGADPEERTEPAGPTRADGKDQDPPEAIADGATDQADAAGDEAGHA